MMEGKKQKREATPPFQKISSSKRESHNFLKKKRGTLEKWGELISFLNKKIFRGNGRKARKNSLLNIKRERSVTIEGSK